MIPQIENLEERLMMSATIDSGSDIDYEEGRVNFGDTKSQMQTIDLAQDNNEDGEVDKTVAWGPLGLKSLPANIQEIWWEGEGSWADAATTPDYLDVGGTFQLDEAARLFEAALSGEFVAEAEGEAGVDYNIIDGDLVIEITTIRKGEPVVDYIKFVDSGSASGSLNSILPKVNFKDTKEQTGFYEINDPADYKYWMGYHGGDSYLPETDSEGNPDVGSLFQGSFLNQGGKKQSTEFEDLIRAALTEADDMENLNLVDVGESHLVIEVSYFNSKKGETITDTMVLYGDFVAEVICDVEEEIAEKEALKARIAEATESSKLMTSNKVERNLKWTPTEEGGGGKFGGNKLHVGNLNSNYGFKDELRNKEQGVKVGGFVQAGKPGELEAFLKAAIDTVANGKSGIESVTVDCGGVYIVWDHAKSHKFDNQSTLFVDLENFGDLYADLVDYADEKLV